MPKVKGKEQLCSSEKYKTYFKSIQGLDGHTLFERYSDIENVVNKRIDEHYRHFLTQPEVDSDTIFWFSKPYNETPRHLSELQGEERIKYEQVKNNTLGHYQSVIASLKSEGKNSEAECLENATKFVNDDFVYCFDDKTVLGIWGMQLRDEVRQPIGVAIKDIYSPIKPMLIRFIASENGTLNGNSELRKQKGDLITENEVPQVTAREGYEFIGWDADPINHKVSGFTEFVAQYKANEIVLPPTGAYPKPEEQPENPFSVRFDAGGNGTLNGVSEYSKYAGDTVNAGEVPKVEPKWGYEFTGWDKNPYDYRVTDDTKFTARYREIPPVGTGGRVTESWWGRFFGVGKGCLSWLLLLLLLALIFMVIWCCLLKKCNFNFCGCECEGTTVVIPDPRPNPPVNPEATVSPCNAQVKSGGEEGYVGIFEMGQPSGTFVFQYNTQSVPDKITIFDGENTSGEVIFFYEGSTEKPLEAVVNFNKPTITIQVTGLRQGTYWEFLVNCP